MYELEDLKERLDTIQKYTFQRLSGVTMLQPHPMNLDVAWKIFKREPAISAGLEEIAFETLQPGFQIECENKDAKKILIDFREDSYIRFDENMQNAILNYLWAGNEFLEPVEFEKQIVRLYNHDPQYMFVETDAQRNVMGYWEFSAYRQAYFLPFELLHWKRNATVNDPYGYSIVHSLVESVKRKLNVWADAVRALHRYGSPIILWIFGNEAIPRMAKGTIDNFISDLRSHPSNDVGAPYGVDAKVLGENFRVVMNFIEYIAEINVEIRDRMRIPPIKATNEDLEMFDKRNQTLQSLASVNIILPLFKRVLDLQGKGQRKNKVNLRWNRFERIERSKKEQNIVKMEMAGIITPNEARQMIGLTEPIKAYDPIAKKEIPNYGNMFIYPIQQSQNLTTGSPGLTTNSNKTNPSTDKTKQPKGRVSKQ